MKNPKRRCGHLKENSIYLRGEIGEFGVLPPFVEFVEPIRCLEKHYRGTNFINGLQFELVNNIETKPKNEITKHLKRLYDCNPISNSLGHMTDAWSFDIIMWVGKAFYAKPKDFMKECRTLGISKKISSKQTPPLILSGRTKLYCIHPRAIQEDGKDIPGIIGYSYLTRVIYTEGRRGGDIPKWVSDLNTQNRIHIVKPDNMETEKKISDFE